MVSSFEFRISSSDFRFSKLGLVADLKSYLLILNKMVALFLVFDFPARPIAHNCRNGQISFPSGIRKGYHRVLLMSRILFKAEESADCTDYTDPIQARRHEQKSKIENRPTTDHGQRTTGSFFYL